MKIFWKIYCWTFGALVLIALISQGVHSIWDAVDVVASLILAAVLFLYAYRKRLFNPLTWKIFAVAFVVWIIIDSFHDFSSSATANQLTKFSAATIWVLAGLLLLLVLPALAALFLYAFKFDSVTRR